MMKELNAQDIKKHTTLHWNSHTPAQWSEYSARVQRMNLLQSQHYLQAMSRLNYQHISKGLITVAGNAAGIVNVLEAGLLKNVVHGVILDRGPLWFDGYGSPEHFDAFVAAFMQQYPKRIGRRIRFIPEIKDTPDMQQIMQKHGYRAKAKSGYETIWLDLKPSLDNIRKNLHSKWRNALNQSERKPLKLVWDTSGISSWHFKWLMKQYLRDKSVRKYDGPSLKTMLALGESFSRGKNMMIGCALLDNNPIAGILLLIHGSSATYQIGYTSGAGRENRAHYVLLWAAIEQLKKQNVQELDLGGVNAKDAEGVMRFKKRMGRKIEKTLGLYYQ